MGKFCSYCGSQIVYEAKFCVNCGKPQVIVETMQNQQNQDIATKRLEEISEVIIHKGVANWCKSSLFVQNGQGVVTNKRFIYNKHDIVKTLEIGALVNLTDGKYEFDISFYNIERVSQGKHGLGKTLKIETKDGSVYNFAVMNCKDWIDIISEYIS